MLQEAYTQLGLPKIISEPLAAKTVPRAEVAAAVLAILLDKDLTIARLNTRLARVEGEHKALVQRYMQLRGLVSMQGIIGKSLLSQPSIARLIGMRFRSW